MFDVGKRLDQRRAHYFKFAAVVRGQFLEQPCAPGCDAQQDTASVGFIAGALEQTFFYGSVCELHYTVVPEAEALGRVGDGRECVGRRPGDLQQQLMLLGLQARGVRGLLTELEKRAKAIAKFGQPLDQAIRGRSYLFHRYIVSRHISLWMPRSRYTGDVLLAFRHAPHLCFSLHGFSFFSRAGTVRACQCGRNRPVPPFRIADNLYYVGVKGVASYLIVTPQGDMLLDIGFRETVPLVEASIRKLGFHVEDVHVLLLSHAHFDHAGGLAAMKSATHARLLASPGDAPLLERGGRDDFAFERQERGFRLVKPDGLLQDGVRVAIGGSWR